MKDTRINEIASFFAYCKHELELLKSTTELGENGLNSTLNGSISKILIQTEEIDRAVYEIVLNGSFETMKSIIKNQFDLLENDFLRLKALDAINCVNTIQTYGNNSQLKDLSFFYLCEYNRLMEVIGLSEFAELIGWDKKKLAAYVNKGNIPKPIKKTSATPLWTIGQIEYFNLILKNRKLFKMRGDWNTPYVNFPVDYFEEFKIISNFTN